MPAGGFACDDLVFHNRRGNLVKTLIWDRAGYVLYAKRLERGKFRIFSSEEKSILNERQLFLLLDGICIGA